MTGESADLVMGIIFCIGLILGAIIYFFLTRIIEIEHDDFYDQWVKDGRPHGMPFWSPPKEEISLGFRSSPWIKGYKWLFTTPVWAKNQLPAAQMIKYYRITSVIALAALLIMFIILFASMPS